MNFPSGLSRKKPMSAPRLISLSFALLILLGATLLTLPISSASGRATPFSDALFTATSAACVTGLVVQNTATYWSGFGQVVLLVLIQIGGMGVITMASLIFMVLGRRIGLNQRNILQEALSAPQVGGILRLTGFILKTTAAIELAGAAALAPVFCRDFGFLRGLWYALFHAVSAFCNAGFDLLGSIEPYSSLTSYAFHPAVNLVIIFLIIVGGLGFLTWDDLRANKLRLRRYRMQSKVILSISAALILIPFFLYFFLEFPGESLGRRLWLSLFQAVTPRTAGFNTYDLSQMSEAGQWLMMGLMLIGGSPGSTAGGMKTTTLAVLLASAAAVFRRRDSARCFGRRLAPETVRHAAAIFLIYLGLFFTCGLIISRIEGLPATQCLFESASAVGTVGLTLGLTPTLTLASRLILMGLMFFGRVGGLTLIYAALSGLRTDNAKLPQERITVG